MTHSSPPFDPDDLARHGGAMRRLAKGLVGDDQEADDLVQQAYVHALEQPPRERGSLGSWLRRVVRHLAIDRLRAGARRPASAVDPAHLPDPGPHRGLELQAHVLDGVRALPEPYRTAVYLRYFEGLGPSEIAERTGAPLKTVKSRLWRALAMLRERLDQEHGERGAWMAVLVPVAGLPTPSLPPLASPTSASPTPASPTPATPWIAGLIMTAKTKLITLTATVAALAVVAFLVFAGEPAGAVEPEPKAPIAAGGETAELDDPRDTGTLSVDAARTEDQSTNDPSSIATAVATEEGLLIRVQWSDGSPAPDVGVTISHSTRWLPTRNLERHVSDADGIIQSGALPAGTIVLRTDRGDRKKIDPASGPRPSEVTLEIEKGVLVHGVVVDGNDSPVADAEIWLQQVFNSWSNGNPVTRSDANGRFTVRDVQNGDSLGALVAGFAPSKLVDLDTLDTSGEQVEITLRVGPTGGAWRGRVVDLDGNPIPGAHVAIGKRQRSAQPRSGGFSKYVEAWSPQWTFTDENGAFAFESVRPGEHSAAIQAADHGLWRDLVTIEAGQTREQDIALGAEATLSGTATDENGDILVGASIHAFAIPPRTSFIQGGQIDYDEIFNHRAALTDENGNYRVTGLGTGTLHIIAQAPRKRGMSESVPYLRHTVEGSPGGELTWDPVITPGRTIEGIVLFNDGHPMPHYFVTITEENPGQRSGPKAKQHTNTTDDKGRFRFVCLDAKSYSIYVQLWDPPAGTPPLERMGLVPGQGAIELKVGYDKPVKQEPCQVLGKVDDAAGRIPHNNALTVHLSSGRSWRTQECEAGAFEFPKAEPGRYRVLVMSGETMVAQTEWFEVGPAEVKDVGTITTEAAGAARVELVLPDAKDADFKPRAFLKRPDDGRSAKVSFAKGTTIGLVENLTPGTYEITVYGTGTVTAKGSVDVIAGQTATTTLSLTRGVRQRFELYRPSDRQMGNATMRILDTRDESVVIEWTEKQNSYPTRPRPVTRTVPRGSWVLHITTDTGIDHRHPFTVDSYEKADPVRIYL